MRLAVPKSLVSTLLLIGALGGILTVAVALVLALGRATAVPRSLGTATQPWP